MGSIPRNYTASEIGRLLWDPSDASEVSASGAIIDRVIVLVRLRSDALPITTSTPILRRTGEANRNRFPNELGSFGKVFHFDGSASVRSRVVNSPNIADIVEGKGVRTVGADKQVANGLREIA